MNERIKFLSKQAGEYADLACEKEGEFYPCYTQKFVDLLVRDILGKVDNRWSHADIKRHLGVE